LRSAGFALYFRWPLSLDKHKRYVSVLCSLLLATLVVLSALNEHRLEVYLNLFTIVYLASCEIFRPRRRWFDLVGGVLFVVFSYFVVEKIMEVLS